MSEQGLQEAGAGASLAPTDGGRPGGPEAADLTAERSERLTRLELVTESQRIRGSLRWSQVVRRVLDLLNYGEETIALADVQVVPLRQGWDDAPRWPYARIRKDAIAFAIPHEEPSPSAAAHPEPALSLPKGAVSQRPLEYVEKVPHPVWLALAAFAVRGDIHLAPGVELAGLPLLTMPGFVALTDAEAVYVPDPSLVWKAAVILVNAAKVEVYCPSAPATARL